MALVLPLVCVQFGSLFFFLLLMCLCWITLHAVAGLARPLVAVAGVSCAVLCCAVAAAAVHGGCRLRRPIARRLPTTVAAARAAVLLLLLLLLLLLAVLWAGVGHSRALGATLLKLKSHLP